MKASQRLIGDDEKCHNRAGPLFGEITRSPETIVVFVYDVSGQLIAEYTDPSQPIQGGGGTSYLTSDHLGSTRVVTDATGGVKARHDYLPFGEETSAGIGGRTTAMKYDARDSTKQRFTSKERDTESGLDYLLARYYSPPQGIKSDAPGSTKQRFTSKERDTESGLDRIQQPSPV